MNIQSSLLRAADAKLRIAFSDLRVALARVMVS